MNKEARPLTQEQRKEFVQLLKDSKTRVLESLTNRYNKRYAKAWTVAITKLAERLGAKKLCEEAVAAQKKLKESDKALRTLGFTFDDRGDLVLTSDGRDRYSEEVDEARDELMASEVEESRKKYETAILNVLATDSVEEAKGIVEPLV
jgi:hypothetical protein